jgi:hypothetical protein
MNNETSEICSYTEWLDFLKMSEKYGTLNYDASFDKQFVEENNNLISYFSFKQKAKLKNGNDIQINSRPFRSIPEIVTFLKEEKEKGFEIIYHKIYKYSVLDYNKLTDDQKKIVKDNGNTGKVLSGYDMPEKDMFTYYGYSLSSTQN